MSNDQNYIIEKKTFYFDPVDSAPRSPKMVDIIAFIPCRKVLIKQNRPKIGNSKSKQSLKGF